MQPDDQIAFTKLLVTAMAVYDHKITAQVAELYFAALGLFSLEQVSDGLSRHLQDGDAGKFYPKPADIIRQIQGVKADDGRPGKDEAWAIAMRATDETDTVLVTDEILAALFVAQPLLDVRDKVAARMAFIESYERLVDIARRQGKLMVWTVSLGDDKQRRIAAIEEGVRAGRLSHEQAEPHRLRIAQETQPISREGVAIVGLLTGPSGSKPLEPEEIRARLAQVKAGISTGTSKQDEAKHQQARDRKSDLERRLEEHQKLIEQLEHKRDD